MLTFYDIIDAELIFHLRRNILVAPVRLWENDGMSTVKIYLWSYLFCRGIVYLQWDI